jgi:glycosyltransferase involved in cell wall biosynthesis
MDKSFSVIVPVYNEAALVTASLTGIDGFMRSWATDYEILVIESGSTDGSGALCDEVARASLNVRVIHEPTRAGYGSALRLGFANAKRTFAWIVTLDIPFPLESIRTAVPLLDSYDCVLSYRSQDPRGFGRRFQSAIYNLLLHGLLGIRTRHVNSAFKVVRVSVVREIPLRSTGWFIDAELLYRLQERGIRCTEIGVPLVDRTAGASTVGLSTWLGVLREMIRFWRDLRLRR